MLASDLNNPEFVGAANPDAALSARFYIKPVQNMYATTEQGRPIFEDRTYVEIFVPGNALSVIDTPAEPRHQQRFPLQWAHFQNAHGGDARAIGTPLTQWPLLTASQVEELKALKFFTVEQIANAGDQQIGNIGLAGGMSPLSFRARAQAYLDHANGTAAPEKQAAEIEKLKEEKKESDTRHAAEMAEMMKRLEALEKKKKE